MPRIETRIVTHALPPIDERGTCGMEGAEIIFHGRVRNTEAGRTIVGLEYEHYEEMAESALSEVAHEAGGRYEIDELVCIHRVGMVPAGAASLRVQICSPHRRAALDAMDWFISEIKARVPIWKWGVLDDGSRFPAEGGRLPLEPPAPSPDR